jgi:acetoin utilization protein AcuB
MTEDPVSVTGEATVRRAISLLSSMEIRHLPIVNERGELIGMVSDRDLRDVSTPYTLTEDTKADDRALDEPVLKLMTEDPVTVTPSASIDDIIDRLIATKVGALPVIDPESRELVGIISYIDVLRELRAMGSGAEAVAR